ncbi:MAG: DUF6798 domain-containing protein [Caldilineaceae bacterium]
MIRLAPADPIQGLCLRPGQPAAGRRLLVPTGMADFRLATGVPVVVTWKSHPYKDVEMLEWKSRVDAVSAFYGEPHCIRIGELYHQYGATHVLSGRAVRPACPIIDVVYQDDAYTLARVK